MLLADLHQGAGVWAEYRELVTDPAHWLLEGTIVLIVDGVILGLAWPFARWYFRRWIARHDREHHGG